MACIQTNKSMKKSTFKNFEELKAQEGQLIGVSDWFKITQDRINDFAKATMDEQWIHVDTERAKTESPFGGTIAHGYLILSLVAKFYFETISFENIKMGINYGTDKVRFMNAVKVNANIRAHMRLVEVVDVEGGVKYKTEVTVEIEGEKKPACVAETLAIVLKN